MGAVRIIGGQWRGRKIHFSSLPGLRPTPNRLRETLFNWLMHKVIGARCLDLFAGSGALGFEALSRGAHSVVMIDTSPQVIKELQTNVKILGGGDRVRLYCGQIPKLKLSELGRFDIVFLDPPFHQNCLPTCYQWLEANHCVAPAALIYIEAERDLQPLPLPTQWSILRQQSAGQVSSYLVKSFLSCR